MNAARLSLSLLASSALLASACGSSSSGTTTSPEQRPCSIPAACEAVEPSCLGMVDNSGKTRFGLRISELDVGWPAGLTSGIVGVAVATDVLPDNAACNLPGMGTFSWLLRFDTVAGTLTTGGAKPVAGPAGAYQFVDEEVAGWSIQPTTFSVDLAADGAFTTPTPQDLMLPMYVDPGATDLPIVLPLRGAEFTLGLLGASQSCIGHYDLAALDPADDCVPSVGSHAFVDGASVLASIRLEDAELVSVPAFDETLCARLALEDPAYVARDAEGTLRCARDATGKIVLPADTCSIPGETCLDAIKMAASFAASSVLIDDD